MKVELQCGDTITIPEGCKAIVKDGSVVFEKEEQKEQEFKDGDVLTSRFDNKIVFIFKEGELKQKDNRNNYYVCHTADYVIDVPTRDNWFFCGYKKDVRLATENEKQFLFDKMKEQGLLWNAGEKRVEKIRWRAKRSEEYYFMNTDLTTVKSSELDDDVDTNRHSAFNYFRTKEYTAEAAKRVKETLRKYHEEIGE
jgi:hypothetical protein